MCVQSPEAPESKEAILRPNNGTTVALKDKYPKAHRHCLILPTAKPIPQDLPELTREHLPLLRAMKAEAESLAEELGFRDHALIGLHAIPSLKPLHMHVISADLNIEGSRIKSKQHYNSFSTDFFLDITKVLQQIEEDGGLSIDEEYLRKMKGLKDQHLKCAACGKSFPSKQTFAELKKHQPLCAKAMQIYKEVTAACEVKTM
jgi:aprataxin